jgi:hypothetical protein
MANGSLSRAHWRTKKDKRENYFVRCYVWRGEHCDRRPSEPLKRARIHATLYTHQRMDADNLMARLKWTLDWMVSDGWITDDSPAVLVWEGVEQAIDRQNQRVEITLAPEPSGGTP